MSAANPRVVTAGTTTTLPEYDFDELAGPAESAVLEFDLLNDGAAAETMVEVSLGCEESDDGGATWHQGNDNTSIPFMRMFQIQAYDQDGDGITPQTTSYTPTGVGARLYLDPIPADCRRKCRAKLVVPAGHSTASKKIKIIPYWSESVVPLPQGSFESGLRGVLSGAGDPSYSALIAGGGLSETGTPDNDVQVARVQWRHQGAPHAHYGDNVTIAASAGGMARWVTLSLGAAWPPTQTASTPVAEPAPVGDRVAAPVGEVLLGYVHRGDGTIVDADIYPSAANSSTDDVHRSPFHLDVDGLDFVLGPGRALVDNSIIRKDFVQAGTLTDDQATVLYIARSNGAVLQVESGDLPAELRAEPVWECTAVSGMVTVRDLRRFIGGEVVEFSAFFAGPAVVDTAAYFVAPYDQRLHVHLPLGVEIGCGSIGDRTTGELRVVLEFADGTPLFSDADEEPQIAALATDLVATGFTPDTTEIPPGSVLRLRISEIPVTGGADDPENVFARVRFEVARP